MMLNSKGNVHVSMSMEKPTKHGIFDDSILCGQCDAKLGKLDNYALTTCRRFPDDHMRMGNDFTLSGVEGDAFAKFVLSVLWRVSISSRTEVRGLSLGKYEDVARDVIFDVIPLSSMPVYQLMLSRIESTKINIEEFYSIPVRGKFLCMNGWSFVLHGFRFMAKMDQKPWPAGGWSIVNGSQSLAGPFIEFERTPEYRAAQDMGVAAKIRRAHKATTG